MRKPTHKGITVVAVAAILWYLTTRPAKAPMQLGAGSVGGYDNYVTWWRRGYEAFKTARSSGALPQPPRGSWQLRVWRKGWNAAAAGKPSAFGQSRGFGHSRGSR